MSKFAKSTSASKLRSTFVSPSSLCHGELTKIDFSFVALSWHLNPQPSASILEIKYYAIFSVRNRQQINIKQNLIIIIAPHQVF